MTLVFGSAAAMAATYYVDPLYGNDSNPGTTQSAAWKTLPGTRTASDSGWLRSAWGAIHSGNKIQAGDTIELKGGGIVNAATGGRLLIDGNFYGNGTAGAPITIRKNAAWGSGSFVYDGKGVQVPDTWALVHVVGISHLTVAGMEIRNSRDIGLQVGGNSTHIKLLELDVHHSEGSGILIGTSTDAPSFSTIARNKSHDNGRGGISMYAARGGYWLIEHNEVYKNSGYGNWDGIGLSGPEGSHHMVVRNNVIHDNGLSDDGEDNLDLGSQFDDGPVNHHYLVQGNEVYGGKGSFKMHGGGTQYVPGVNGTHIARFNRFTGIPFVTYGFPSAVALYNNTFVDCHQCVMFYNGNNPRTSLGDSSFTGGDAGRMNLKNNIFFQETPSDSYMLLTPGNDSLDLSYRSVRFQNNLYKFAPGQKIWWKTGFWAPIDANAFNSYKNSNAPDHPDTGSIRTVASSGQVFANYAARDYHPVAGSPAIDAGTPLSKATNAGANSTTLKVDRASYFFDGYCVNGECLGTPDSIKIGRNAPIKIAPGGVNDATNTITLATPASWNSGDPVTLQYAGAAPDIGAFEADGQQQEEEEEPPAAGSQSLFTTQVPVAFYSGLPYELGTRFKVTTDGKVTGVRIYTNAAESGVHNVRLWRADGTLLAGPYRWTVTPGTAGWKTFPLPAPVNISAGVDHIVAVSSGPDKIFADTQYAFEQPLANGNIVTYTGSGTYTTTLGSMPTLIYRNSNYFRDIVFVPHPR